MCGPGAASSWPRQYIEDAGGEVVGEEYVPLGTQDFSSVAQTIAGSGADLIFPALVGGDAIAFETQAVDFGIGQDAIPRLANIYEENVLGAMGPAVTAGMRVTMGYFKEVDNALNSDFVSRYYERFGADAPPHATFSSHIYDAALLYAAAANAAGTTDTAAVGSRHGGTVARHTHRRHRHHRQPPPGTAHLCGRDPVRRFAADRAVVRLGGARRDLQPGLDARASIAPTLCRQAGAGGQTFRRPHRLNS